MAFGLKYFAELRSKYKEVFWRVEIAERDYTGVSEQMSFDGNKPLTITWEKRGDDFYIPVKASEVTLNILCRENFRYINLFTSDPRRFRVSIFRNTKLYWRGYVVADLYSENFTAPPYQVSIKAVDGFNLLQSIPFRNLDSTPISGKKHLWDLVASCIDLLELEVDVSDWMDLYAEGMNLNISPLRQVYVEMERLYSVYSEPTYRDILELCLRPFAGQIFQSNGSLHIRRAISLYNDTRPMSFYSVGKEFPVGWIITADGRCLRAHRSIDGTSDEGDNSLMTEATREQIDSMWGDDINMMGSSVMDISPALRNVKIDVKNKMMDNIIPQLGFYELSRWYDSDEFLSLRNANTLTFTGDSSNKGKLTQTIGYYVTQCAYVLTLECTLKAIVRRWSQSGSYRPSGYGGDFTLKIEYGIKVVGSSFSRWLQDDGHWALEEEYITDYVKTSDEVSKKIEIQGIPTSGWLFFVIKQTLKSEGTDRYGSAESIDFVDMKISVNTGDEYEDSLKYEIVVNHANNADMNISLPIADIPNVPNDQLIYGLYFTNSKNTPTRMWRTKGGNDYNTLINHLVQCALRYSQKPSRRISGEMFTGKHIDMNTVVQDDKFLRAGFYVNSLELNAVEDSFNTELVEMPELLRSEVPPQGDHCVLVANLGFAIKTTLKCAGMIVMLSTDNRIFTYDTASTLIKHLLSYPQSVNIYPADSYFAVVDGLSISIVDYRGVVIKRKVLTYDNVATYMGGYIYILASRTSRPRSEDSTPVTYYSLYRPDYVYTDSSYRRGYASYGTQMAGDITGLLKSFSTIVINTATGSYLHDRRVEMDMTLQTLPEGTEVKTISDYFMCENLGTQFNIYRRDSFTTRTLVKTISGRADFADHTLGEVAFTKDKVVSIWVYQNGTTRIVRNVMGESESVKGLSYINGDLYIVRNSAIYKYMPQK